MKKGFFYFMTSLLFVFCSCEDEKENVKDVLSVKSSQTAFEAGGGKADVAIQATANWETAVLSKWIVLTPERGSADIASTVMEVARNMQAEPRSAEIRFLSGNAEPVVLKIEQQGLVELRLTADTLNFKYTGGKQTVEIHATAAWNVEGMNEWCKVSEISGEGGAAVLEVETLPNDDKQREVVLKFTMGELTSSLVMIQEGESMEAVLKREREVLMKFYNAAGGNDWSSSRGWGDNSVPVGEWVYVRTNDDGRVISLDFDGEYSLKGKLTPELKELKKLKKLKIPFGNFNGATIPEELGELKDLEEFILKSCMFTGELPPALGNLEKLKYVNLENGTLKGEPLSIFRNCKDLVYLSLGRNDFRGKPDLSGLTKLEFLNLMDNAFEGGIDFLTSLPSIMRAYLHENNFSGSIPVGIGDLKKLENLQLSDNNLTGSLPKECVKPERMSRLDVSGNRLSGLLPEEILNWEYNEYDEDEEGNEIVTRKKYDWSDSYNWKKICEQQAGYGFGNAPKKPE